MVGFCRIPTNCNNHHLSPPTIIISISLSLCLVRNDHWQIKCCSNQNRGGFPSQRFLAPSCWEYFVKIFYSMSAPLQFANDKSSTHVVRRCCLALLSLSDWLRQHNIRFVVVVASNNFPPSGKTSLLLLLFSLWLFISCVFFPLQFKTLKKLYVVWPWSVQTSIPPNQS